MQTRATSRLNRAFYRNGPSHRDGADVSFSDIIKIFGFKTATIGKWVNKQEQQIAANLFFDALCDFMTILGVPEKVISLNGSLSLAFGKGGQKYSSAHYNSHTRTLALAKNAGGGALAHEWFHAFDHYIVDKLFKGAKKSDFASVLWLQHGEVIEHPLNNMLEECYQHMFLKAGTDDLSSLFVKSVAADKALNSYYYAQPQEVCARAFEAWVQDNPLKNAFLVQGTKQSTEAKLGIYPESPQRQLIAHFFQRYFQHLGLAVDQQH